MRMSPLFWVVYQLHTDALRGDQTVVVCVHVLLNSSQKALWVGQRTVECVSQFVDFLWR